jgi:hypothetical protein
MVVRSLVKSSGSRTRGRCSWRYSRSGPRTGEDASSPHSEKATRLSNTAKDRLDGSPHQAKSMAGAPNQYGASQPGSIL